MLAAQGIPVTEPSLPVALGQREGCPSGGLRCLLRGLAWASVPLVSLPSPDPQFSQLQNGKNALSTNETVHLEKQRVREHVRFCSYRQSVQCCCFVLVK